MPPRWGWGGIFSGGISYRHFTPDGVYLGMTLTLSDDLVQATRLSEEQILRELAVTLFQGDHLTLAQAAQLARMDRLSFQHHLASRGIPFHYGEAGYAEDLRTLSSSVGPE
jgi:predicted HTH domain antitoxin